LIGDTTEAIVEYINSISKERSSFYLEIYGILQAIYLQQDALASAAKALNIPVKFSKQLLTLRNIRNKIAGHPVKEKKRKICSYHFISRIESSKKRVKLLSIDSKTNEILFETFDIPFLILTQLKDGGIILENIVRELEDEARRHKLEYKNMKLIRHFNITSSYEISKIYESIHGNYPGELALAYINNINSAVTDFENDLIERKLLGNLPGVELALEEIKYPINRLMSHYQNGEATLAVERNIFLFFVEKKLEELKIMATDLDVEYAK